MNIHGYIEQTRENPRKLDNTQFVEELRQNIQQDLQNVLGYVVLGNLTIGKWRNIRDMVAQNKDVDGRTKVKLTKEQNCIINDSVKDIEQLKFIFNKCGLNSLWPQESGTANLFGSESSNDSNSNEKKQDQRSIMHQIGIEKVVIENKYTDIYDIRSVKGTIDDILKLSKHIRFEIEDGEPYVIINLRGDETMKINISEENLDKNSVINIEGRYFVSINFIDFMSEIDFTFFKV